MAELVASVKSAVEDAVAGEHADVVFVEAAELVALVTTAGFFAEASAVTEALLVFWEWVELKR